MQDRSRSTSTCLHGRILYNYILFFMFVIRSILHFYTFYLYINRNILPTALIFQNNYFSMLFFLARSFAIILLKIEACLELLISSADGTRRRGLICIYFCSTIYIISSKLLNRSFFSKKFFVSILSAARVGSINAKILFFYG